MKRYTKGIDGKNVIKTLNRIIVYKDGKQIINPSKEMVLADGWVEYTTPVNPEPSEEQLVERERQRKLNKLHEYDESSNVNDCIIIYQGQELQTAKDEIETYDFNVGYPSISRFEL